MIELTHLPIRHGKVPLRIARGHFATNHSHINYYIDLTFQKARLSEAKDSAYELVSGMGNNVIALEHIREACRLEPSNMQYQMLLNRMEGGGAWYQQQQMQGGYRPVFYGGSDCCTKLCIANIVCNLCCGGGMCCNPYGGGGSFYI